MRRILILVLVLVLVAALVWKFFIYKAPAPKGPGAFAIRDDILDAVRSMA